MTAAHGPADPTDAERLWCVERHPIVLATTDVLFPWHWEGNEEDQDEAQPVFRQVEPGARDQPTANGLLAEPACRCRPEECLQAGKAVYAGK